MRAATPSEDGTLENSLVGIVEELDALDFTAWTMTSDSRQFGSPLPMQRITVIAVDMLPTAGAEHMEKCKRILMQARREPLAYGKFMLDPTAAQHACGQSIRVNRPSKVARQKGGDWEQQHEEFFSFIGVPWPLKPEDYAEFLHIGTLGPREKEIVIMAEALFPENKLGFSFMDASLGLHKIFDYPQGGKKNLRNPWTEERAQPWG